MGVYFDREPYANVDALHATRFLGLSPVGNKDKQVPLHPAFDLSFVRLFVKILSAS